MRRRVALLLTVLALAACAGDAQPVSGYNLREGAIDGPSRLTAAEAATIDVSNTGEYAHTFVVTDMDGVVIMATGLVQPSEQTALEADLEPGTYVFSCRIVAEDDEGNLVDHYEQGMHRTVSVES
jgi:hypothetical protein